jgi:hypothetical protein
MKTKIPFVSGQSQSRSKSIDLREAINVYPEKEKADAKNVAAYIGTPGLRLKTVVNDDNGNLIQSPPRGFYVTGQKRRFCVYSNGLYEIIPPGYVVKRATILTTNGYVYMADNGNQMMITDGRNGYGFDLKTSKLTKITDPIFPQFPGTCTYRDGYFITHDTDTNYTYASAAFDVFTWPVAHKVAKETNSDNVVAVISTATYLWVFGQSTAELWYSTGQDDIGAPPFVRAQEMVISVGCMAPASVVTNGNDVFWLGSNPAGGNVIWMANSFTPQRITTHSEEFLIGQMDSATDATAYCYQEEGHFFYVINFPEGSTTHCYDLSTGLWHRRGYWNATTGQLETHLALFACSVGSDVLCLDRRNGNVYSFDLGMYSDNGDYIHRIATMSHIHQDELDLFIDLFELTMGVGVGLGDGMMSGGVTTASTTTVTTDSDPVNDNPQISLQWSKDGGHTWSKEHWASIGKIGNFKKRVRWCFTMGKSRDWVFRVSTIAKVKTVWIAAYANIEIEPK